MTAIVLQARLDSCRLPRKSLLPLDGEPLVFRVMQALRTVPCDGYVLACPDDCVSEFAPWADRAGFGISPGPDEDVLGRYCGVIRRLGIDRVIRATADNPFVFADAVTSLNAEAAARDADYAGYTGLPYGAGVESVDAEALLRAEQETLDPPEREHVCPYLYSHGDRFRLHRPLAPLAWQRPALRVTVDTPEDYRRACALYDALSAEPFGKTGGRYLGTNIIETAERVFNRMASDHAKNMIKMVETELWR